MAHRSTAVWRGTGGLLFISILLLVFIQHHFIHLHLHTMPRLHDEAKAHMLLESLPANASSATAGAARLQQQQELQSRVQELEDTLARLQKSAAASAGAGISGTGAASQSIAQGTEIPRKTRGPTLDEIPAGSIVWVTITYGVFQDLMLNWVAHLRLLQVPYVVITFDAQSEATCRRHGVRHITYEFPQSDKEHWEKNQFTYANAQKPGLVADLLEQRRWAAIVLSDVDAVWLRTPADLLDAHPTADVISSTDCLSHKAEVAVDLATPQAWEVARCGHLPGTKGEWLDWNGLGFNSGLLVFRNTAAALAALRGWAGLMQPNAEGHFDSEQGALNKLMLTLQAEDAVKATEEDPRVIWVAGDTLRLLPAPVLLFANGHVAFIQHLPERFGVAPHVVHATFIMGNHDVKAARLQEAGLWRLDPDGYYASSTDNYLSYENHVDDFISSVMAWANQTGKAVVENRQHMLAAAYQLSVLRDALAVAEVLNRTLILPQFRCYCDQDWSGTALQDCKMLGADVLLPFDCPADLLISFEADDMRGSNFSIRHSSFLSHPKVPAVVRQSRQLVLVQPPGGSSASSLKAGSLAANAATLSLSVASTLKHGARYWDVVDALGTSTARVVHLQGLRPGFGDAEDDDVIDARFQQIATRFWCCTGQEFMTPWEEQKFMYWPYTLPQQLRSREAAAQRIASPSQVALVGLHAPLDLTADGQYIWSTWGVAEQRRPDFCDSLPKSLAPFVRFPQHPCKYLPRT